MSFLLFAPLAAAAPYPEEPLPVWKVALVSKTTVDSEDVEPLEAPVRPKTAPQSTFERIAWCESKNVATAKNPASTASGRFQFLKGSWEYYGTELWGSTAGKSVFDYEDNTELAAYVYKKYGTSPWEASSHCWR